MFAKLDVNGPTASPLYEFLKNAAKNDDGTTDITWNFTKFLVDGDGDVIKRYAPKVTPEAIANDVSTMTTRS